MYILQGNYNRGNQFKYLAYNFKNMEKRIEIKENQWAMLNWYNLDKELCGQGINYCL